MIPAFVISLKSRGDRRQYIQDNYYHNDLYKLSIFDAFDGKNIDNNPPHYIDLKNQFLSLNETNYKKQVKYKYEYLGNYKPGELGCFMSHLLLWKKIIDEKIEKAIIYEDDCIFNSDYHDKLKQVLTHELPQNFAIVYLGGKMGKDHVDSANIRVSENIFIKREKYPYGTFSYIISNHGARILYHYILKEFKGHLGVDYFMDEFLIKNNHPVHLVQPMPIYSTTNNHLNNIFTTSVQ